MASKSSSPSSESSRHFRFSLRTLLGFTTFVAVLLGLCKSAGAAGVILAVGRVFVSVTFVGLICCIWKETRRLRCFACILGLSLLGALAAGEICRMLGQGVMPEVGTIWKFLSTQEECYMDSVLAGAICGAVLGAILGRRARASA